MGDFIGSYVTIDDEDVLSSQLALLRAELPVSIMQMDQLHDDNECMRRLQAVDALGSLAPMQNDTSAFRDEEIDFGDIGVEPMSLFAPKSFGNHTEDKLFSVDLNSTKKAIERMEVKIEDKALVAEDRKKTTLKTSIMKFLWRKKNDGKTNK
ncbi:unnamed protein product [Agarophyton chilense]|eukprot:gb/GEZJ01005110.1/.p1 GENE.gb/GEZJ01005110.1/~~gb/GEZJ01005110.1/.p1  ORF type:complete len:152 (+),score=30.30 gb/GEZJ01005110.1/:644-1099(+)